MWCSDSLEAVIFKIFKQKKKKKHKTKKQRKKKGVKWRTKIGIWGPKKILVNKTARDLSQSKQNIYCQHTSIWSFCISYRLYTIHIFTSVNNEATKRSPLRAKPLDAVECALVLLAAVPTISHWTTNGATPVYHGLCWGAVVIRIREPPGNHNKKVIQLKLIFSYSGTTNLGKNKIITVNKCKSHLRKRNNKN